MGITSHSGIMSYIGRSTSNKLYGTGTFQEAKVNQWIAWSECLKPRIDAAQNMIFNAQKDVDMKAFNESVEAVKKEVSVLNNALKGKKWLVGDSVTMADIACGTV